MRLIKSISFIVTAAAIIIIGHSEPSQIRVPGGDTQAPVSFPRIIPFQTDKEDRGIMVEESFTIEMVPDETHAAQGTRILPQADLDLSTPTASFVIEYVPDGDTDYRGVDCLDPPAGVQTAFEYAADIWAATIHSTVPITIHACWADSLGSPLGYASSGSSVNFVGAPLSDTYYSYALANALHGADLEPSRYDMNITYNSQYPYYFGTDANTLEDEYDFVTLALHEIGHGLNFFGIVYYNAETSEGFVGSDSGYHNNYDNFMVDGIGNPLTSYTSPSIELGVALQSNDLWFNGSYAMAANGGGLVKMYAPPFWKPGSSYVHLDYDTFNGTSNSLMVYALSKGSANHDTGAVTRGLLQDLGWPDRLQPYPPEIVWASYETFTDRVRISWSIPSSATTYEVHRNTTTDPSGAALLTDAATASPYDDTSADPGLTYFYWVKACNIAGCSEFSDIPAEGKVGIIPIPEAPTNVNASNGTYPDEVHITWVEPDYADYYKVYRDIDDGIYGATLLSDVVISNEYTDSPPAEFIYFYWIRACRGVDCSSYSEPDPGYITPTRPLPPTGLDASDGTYKDKVAVSWNASLGDKIYYKIYRNTTDSTIGAILLVDSLSDLYYDDTSAAPGTDYFYWVIACDADDCSGYSSSDMGYVQRTVPEKPTGLTASEGLFPDRVHLYWTATSNTDYYRIFRNTTNTTTGAIEMESAHPIYSYDDLYVITETTYYYFIKACNAEGCSTYSNSDSGYPGYPYRIYLPVTLK